MAPSFAEQTIKSSYGLENHGLLDLGNVYWNLSTPALYEHAICKQEALLAHMGPLVVRTGLHTVRSPNDKFVVCDTETEGDVWWGKVNRPFEPDDFDHLQQRMEAYFQHRDIYVQDCFAGADSRYRLPIRMITERAWHSLFAHVMFIRPTPEELTKHVPEFTVIHAPGFHATPNVDHTLSPTFILFNFSKRLILIGGTEYVGEAKKAVFSVLNYFLPRRGIFPMHCSANYGKNKYDVAVFLGLSGTGKTTLSADPNRTLIGDDEHGWSDDGVFNFEGGCYAKVIRLSKEGEPEIYEKIRQFGTVLENVDMDVQTRRIDLDSERFTENTRAAYSIQTIANADVSGTCGHPKHIIYLMADAFGVMPPVARLNSEQALYYFISGYTARVAGTERGVTEPAPTFSPCFGAPFLPLHPTEYAKLLRDKLFHHKARVWLVNTGWTGGPYGIGHRMSLQHTRAIITAILEGALNDVEVSEDAIFGLNIPKAIPNIPVEILNPRDTWGDKEAYDDKAADVARQFRANFEQYADAIGADVVAAGPKA